MLLNPSKTGGISPNESTVEAAALEWFGELGYTVGHGPHLGPDEPAAERTSFGDVILVDLLLRRARRQPVLAQAKLLCADWAA